MKIVVAYEHIRRLVGAHSQLVTDLARELGRRGHEVVLVCDSVLDPEMFPQLRIIARRGFQSGESHRFLILRRWARRVVEALDPDVAISFHWALPGDVVCPMFGSVETRLQREHRHFGAIARQLLIQGHPNVLETRSVERLTRRDRRVRSIIALSREMADDLVAAHPWTRSRLSIIPGASSIRPEADAGARSALRREGRSILGLGDDDVVFLWAAKRGILHGRSQLMTAFAEVVAAGHPGARLVVAGEGQWKMHDFAVDARCDDQVRVVGRTAAMPMLLEACDVGVCPVLHSTVGRHVWECLAFGRPVIASTHAAGAHRMETSNERGEPARAGRLVEPYDIPSLRDAMIAFMNGEIRGRAIDAARRIAPEFRFEDFTSRIETHLARTAEARRSGRPIVPPAEAEAIPASAMPIGVADIGPPDP